MSSVPANPPIQPKLRVVVSRKWDHPEILAKVDAAEISLSLDLDRFTKALALELDPANYLETLLADTLEPRAASLSAVAPQLAAIARDVRAVREEAVRRTFWAWLTGKGAGEPLPALPEFAAAEPDTDAAHALEETKKRVLETHALRWPLWIANAIAAASDKVVAEMKEASRHI